MSYSRFPGSDWDIFWHADSRRTKTSQRLAVYHCSAGEVPRGFTYNQVRDMLLSDDFGLIAERNNLVTVAEKEYLRACLESWLEDVRSAYPDTSV